MTAFADLAEILRGFLPRTHRDFRHSSGSRNLRVWFGSWHEHYEIQAISPPFAKTRSLEVGFHAEHPRVEDNDEVLDLLARKERSWRKALGRDPIAGPFVGRKEHKARWRRCSELWEDVLLDSEGIEVEAAERLAEYVRAFEPILARSVTSKCTCWKEAGVWDASSRG